MAKATRVRYSGIAPYIDDTQANRVQALGSSSRLSTEDMKELGTLNIVEIVDDVPVVDVSIDVNENGTNDVFALFANKGYGCNVVALPSGGNLGTNQVKVRSGSYYMNGNRIFFEGTNLTIASGSTAIYLKPEVSGGATAKVSTTTVAGAIKIADLSTTAVNAGLIKQSDITDQRPFATLTANDFELAKADIFVPVKQSGTGDVVARTMYMERVFLNNLDFSYQVSGVATASMKAETDNKRWFLNNAAQVVVDEFKAPAGSTLTLSQVATQLANGNFILSCVKNGTPITEGNGITVNAATKVVTFSTALVAGDLVKFRYVSTAGGKFFAPVPAAEDPHPELAGGIKQGQIELYLNDNAGQRLTRVQSARISLPLNRDQLNELGSMYTYDRPLQLPLNANITLELTDSDLELMARFAGYTNLSSVNEISILDLLKNMDLTIKIFRETDVKRAKLAAGHPDKYAIKTIQINNLIPQNENWDVRVDSDATQTFEFLAHNISISDSIQ